MSEITIVSAYFDIGRKNWKGLKRDNNKYLEYFKFWARINNNIIVYTIPELVDDVLLIRKNFGLLNKTKVIAITDVTKCEKEIYIRMKKVAENKIFQTFHFHKEIKHPESWSLDYNYITSLKSYFVYKAVSDFNLKGTIAWLDFGFNHGGNLGLVDKNDFNFTWNYNFSNKIHLFAYQKININRPIFDIIRNLDTYIMGGIMIAPANLWQDFYHLSKQSILSLIRCGFCDDDQTIALMCYYEKPELFEIHNVDYWFDGIKKFGGEHFKTDTAKKIINKPYKYYRYRARILLGDGHYTLAWKFLKKYLITKIKG